MVGEKPRTKYKRRKCKAFSGVAGWAKKREETVVSEEEDNLDQQPSTSTCDLDPSNVNDSEQSSSCIGASRQKLGDRGFESDSTEFSSDENDDNCELNTIGYRLVDMSILSSTLSDIHKCEDGMGNILFY